MSVNVVNKSTGALTKVAGNAITEASGINYSHTTSGMSATNVQDAIDESYGSLKSGLTNLDNEVNGDATTYPYADVITIPDAIPANVADCTVKIEPVQDLHGYDKPWVGGAYKNKAYVNINSGETALTEIKDNDNNVIGVNADVGAAGVVVTVKMATVSIENGKTYTLSGSPNDKSNNTYRLDVRTQAQGQLYNNWNEIDNPTITATEDVTLDIYLRIAANYAVNNLVFHPQIEEGSSATTFAPYTNICPITGHTEASVQRDGRNLCKKTVRGYIDSINNKISINNDSETAIFYAIKGKTYTLSASSKNRRTIAHIASDNIVDNMPLIEYITMPTGVYTWTATWEGWTAWYFLSDVSSEAESTIQIELGSTATPYVPYAGKTYTIALGDTIYGGTVDFDSGVMTVTHALVDLGDLNWTYSADWGGYSAFFSSTLTDYVGNVSSAMPKAICSIYEGVTRDYILANDIIAFAIGTDKKLAVRNSNYSDAATFKTAMTGQTVCYELATPTTIQLTPTQIQLLKGTNTLTASTGQISVTVNGVSGAIGAVQEQVNGLAEEVATGGYSETLLYSGTGESTYALEQDFDTFDAIVVQFTRSNNIKIVQTYPASFLSELLTSGDKTGGFTDDKYCIFTVTSKTLFTRDSSNDLNIENIYGIKY